MYQASTVAHYIIDFCNREGLCISNLKLQKLLYFVQAEFLVSQPDHAPCFADGIEARDFGPVVPNVYREFRMYGNASIPSINNDPYARSYDEFTKFDRALIDGIIQKTANYSASQLVQITRNQSPWLDAYRPGYNNKISNRSIREFFEE